MFVCYCVGVGVDVTCHISAQHASSNICMYVCVCVYVCMYIRMHACIMYMILHIHLCMHIHTYIRMHVRIRILRPNQSTHYFYDVFKIKNIFLDCMIRID